MKNKVWFCLSLSLSLSLVRTSRRALRRVSTAPTQIAILKTNQRRALLSLPLSVVCIYTGISILTHATRLNKKKTHASLEKTTKKAYITWCFLTILFNYSLIAHWAWNPQGWLFKLGFMDGAGSGVVHLTGGTSSFVALWYLGARGGAVNFQTGHFFHFFLFFSPPAFSLFFALTVRCVCVCV